MTSCEHKMKEIIMIFGFHHNFRNPTMFFPFFIIICTTNTSTKGNCNRWDVKKTKTSWSMQQKKKNVHGRGANTANKKVLACVEKRREKKLDFYQRSPSKCLQTRWLGNSKAKIQCDLIIISDSSILFYWPKTPQSCFHLAHKTET